MKQPTALGHGAMTGIDDLNAIARLDFLCDDIGMVTMNTGAAPEVAMDSGVIPFSRRTALPVS